MTAVSTRRPTRVSIIVAIILLASAIVVAGFLRLLGISVTSSRHFDPKPLKPDLRIETLSC